MQVLLLGLGLLSPALLAYDRGRAPSPAPIGALSITCPPNATIQCGECVNPSCLGTPVVTGACAPDPVVTFVNEIVYATCPAARVQFQINRTWTVSDSCGRSASCVQSIQVVRTVVPVDVAPGICPNEFFLGTSGTIPVAVLGTSALPVFALEPLSFDLWTAGCALGPVSPVGFEYMDAGTPHRRSGSCSCHAAGGDGQLDLVLHFDRLAMETALGLNTYPDGSDVRLFLTGGIAEGLCVLGTDCVRVRRGAAAHFLILDEDTLDNDVSSIVAAAQSHGVSPDFLINDDSPTEGSNPPLRWNQLFPGDVVLLPGGQVDDEGVFALPANPPFSAEAFAAGTVPQSQLDHVPQVMPLRNHDLARLVGQTCVAVVYDSDVSMNYLPIQANLQGERQGLFTFTVLEVVVPGSLPESTSSSSLYDLLVRVESPMTAGASFEIQVRDHEPDSISIADARYHDASDLLEVTGVSGYQPSALMTVSIEGLVLEAPMTYVPSQQKYRYLATSSVDLEDRRVTISTDKGGASNKRVD